MARPRIAVKAFDQMVRDQFAAALELGFAQSEVDPLPPGHISLEEKERGSLYAKWRRQGANGKPASPLYLGSAESETSQQAMARLEDLQRIQRTAKALRKLGLAAEDHGSALVLAQLANAGFFKSGGVLVGTRAFRCLTNHLGYAVSPNVSTQDVDIARPHLLKLASPFPSGGMLALLKQTGLRFVEVPNLTHQEASSSWRVMGKEIKLDLLVPAKGKQKPYSTVAVRELGAHATALEYLDYLMEETLEAIVVGKSQLIPVRVPSPARFFWHKLAISPLRPVTFTAKKEKDMAQAACLLMCLADDSHDELRDELLEAYANTGSGMRKGIKKSLPVISALLNNKHRKILEELMP